MKFVSTRVLRNRPGAVREMAAEDDLVLTSNGKPIAILIGADEDNFEEAAMAVQLARAQLAVSRMRRQAAKEGNTRLSSSDIDREIRSVRAHR